MNLLFVNYGDFTSNSLNHIGGFARELQRRGHVCAVAVPAGLETLAAIPDPGFVAVTHADLAGGRPLFPDGRAADLLHAWTPRENVRRAALAYLHRHPATALVVHLEDNEAELAAAFAGEPFAALRQRGDHELRLLLPDGLSHPGRFGNFLRLAHGCTVIVDQLRAFVPDGVPAVRLLPGVDTAVYHPQAPDPALRTRLGLRPDERLLVYTGGTTFANLGDLRALYRALRLINDRGQPCRLVRTGINPPEYAAELDPLAPGLVIELGFVEKARLGPLLALADVLVQPGSGDAFNDFRLPSKVPEFLSMGRPVVLPRANLARELEHGREAWLLDTGAAEEIADACLALFADPTLAARLGADAGAFARTRFDLSANTDGLVAFYERVRSGARPVFDDPALPPDEDAVLAARLDASLGLRLRSWIQETGRLQEEAARQQQAIDNLNRTVEDLHRGLQAQRAEIARLEIARVYEESRVGAALAAARQEAVAHDSDHRTGETERKALQAERDRLADKVRRMSASLSWRITAPGRALRRWLLDPLVRRREARTAELAQAAAQRHPGNEAYYAWVQRYDRPSPPATERPLSAGGPGFVPLISVLMPVYNAPERWLRQAIESVIAQRFPDWELCIADDASPAPHVSVVLAEYARRDPRIRVVRRETNGHISAASNSALELASGEFVALLDHDDELPPHALACVAERIRAQPGVRVIYTDEDKIDEDGVRFCPHFKPDWNPDLLTSQNYLSHLVVYRTADARAVGGFRPGLEGSQDWDLALRITERTRAEDIAHIPRVLYHWRAIEGSTALHSGEKTYHVEAARRALAEHFQRRGRSVTLQPVRGDHWRVRHALPAALPLVSLVIPTRNRRDLLELCVGSLFARTTYPRYEIVVADNDSDDPELAACYERWAATGRFRVVPCPGPFNFSAIVNRAVAEVCGELVGLLNNDLEAINGDWLDEMAAHALRPEIGCVGARLYYPNDTLQHAGVITGLGGVAGHAFKHFPRDHPGNPQFRPHLAHNVSAVTAACLVLRRELFHAAGGFDEKNLRVAFNDVDFCLRVEALGVRNLYTPFAEFYHHESASRGHENSPEKIERFRSEIEWIKSRWGDRLLRDPAYNPNLTLDREDFSLAEPPRVPAPA